MASFRKRSVQKPIKGTRTSPQTGQVITSTGNLTLDAILGGGLPLGSLFLIEEDTYVTHAKILAKYFLAEGLMSSQRVFLASLDDDPDEFIVNLPRPMEKYEIDMEERSRGEDCDGGRTGYDENSGDGGDASQNNKNGLRIAWRYNDLPVLNAEPDTTKIGHHFNFLGRMSPELTRCAHCWDDSARNEMADDDSDEREPLSDQDEISPSGDNITSMPQSTTVDNNITCKMHKDEDNNLENTQNVIHSSPLNFGDDIDLIAQDTITQFESIGDTTKSIPISTEKTAIRGSVSEADAQMAPQQQQQPAIVAPPPPCFTNGRYKRLLKEIHSLLRQDHHVEAPNQRFKQLCRICITSLGSPQWFDENYGRDLLKFLTILRAIVRGSLAVCVITMPMHLVAKKDPLLVPQLRNLVDYSIELESFAGSERETHPAFKMYHGIFHMHKMSAVNSLTAYMPETCDLAFKLRQKKFVIEKLHLPPELQEDPEKPGKATMSCASAESSLGKSGINASMDF